MGEPTGHHAPMNKPSLSMSDAFSALRFSPPDDREELARAEVYGLLASLCYAPPSHDLYEQLRVAVTEAPAAGAFLETSWSEVVAAARRLTLDAVADEYVALFGGVGKPEVCLYASWFMAGFLNDRPLVELRGDLAVLGLERPPAVLETEDHIASLCEVMRYLIAGDDAGVSNLAAQQRFFDAHLRPWVERLCDTIGAHPRADFYRALAGFARDFFAVEAQGFDLLEAH
jgi:TorA maturation chaperone TorD